MDANFQLSNFWILALACGAFLFGFFLKRRIALFQKLCWPVPFIGAIPVAILLALLRGYGVCSLQLNPSLNETVLQFFLASVALFGSWKVLKQDFSLVLVFWALACILSFLQAGLALGAGRLLHWEPDVGTLISTVSLMGGFSTIQDYAPAVAMLDHLPEAQNMAMGAAHFGVLSTLMLGAPMGLLLIRRHSLSNKDSKEFSNSDFIRFISSSPLPFYQRFSTDVIQISFLIFASIALGDLFSSWINTWISFPQYLSAMLVALLFRGLFDAIGWKIDGLALRTVNKVFLTLYIALSICSLRLDFLSFITPEIALVLCAEVLLTCLFSYFAYFRLLGKSYGAMLCSVGGLGFSLGMTANGLSNMQALSERYGPCSRIFFDVSIVGSILIGISNSFIISFLLAR